MFRFSLKSCGAALFLKERVRSAVYRCKVVFGLRLFLLFPFDDRMAVSVTNTRSWELSKDSTSKTIIAKNIKR